MGKEKEPHTGSKGDHWKKLPFGDGAQALPPESLEEHNLGSRVQRAPKPEYGILDGGPSNPHAFYDTVQENQVLATKNKKLIKDNKQLVLDNDRLQRDNVNLFHDTQNLEQGIIKHKWRQKILTAAAGVSTLFGLGGGYYLGQRNSEHPPSSLRAPAPLQADKNPTETAPIAPEHFHQGRLYVALAKAELPSTLTNIRDLVKKTINLDAHCKKSLEEFRGGNKQAFLSPNASAHDPNYADKELVSALAVLEQTKPQHLPELKEALENLHKVLQLTEKRIRQNTDDWLHFHPIQPRYDPPTFGPEENRITPSLLVEYASSAVDELLKNPTKSPRNR